MSADRPGQIDEFLPGDLRRNDTVIAIRPEDVALALRQADATARWEALTAGKRRGLLYQIGTAKTAATRAKRIHALIQSLT